jgi:hypothetical protein
MGQSPAGLLNFEKLSASASGLGVVKGIWQVSPLAGISGPMSFVWKKATGSRAELEVHSVWRGSPRPCQ